MFFLNKNYTKKQYERDIEQASYTLSYLTVDLPFTREYIFPVQNFNDQAQAPSEPSQIIVCVKPK